MATPGERAHARKVYVQLIADELVRETEEYLRLMAAIEEGSHDC